MRLHLQTEREKKEHLYLSDFIDRYCIWYPKQIWGMRLHYRAVVPTETIWFSVSQGVQSIFQHPETGTAFAQPQRRTSNLEDTRCKWGRRGQRRHLAHLEGRWPPLHPPKPQQLSAQSLDLLEAPPSPGYTHTDVTGVAVHIVSLDWSTFSHARILRNILNWQWDAFSLMSEWLFTWLVWTIGLFSRRTNCSPLSATTRAWLYLWTT